MSTRDMNSLRNDIRKIYTRNIDHDAVSRVMDAIIEKHPESFAAIVSCWASGRIGIKDLQSQYSEIATPQMYRHESLRKYTVSQLVDAVMGKLHVYVNYYESTIDNEYNKNLASNIRSPGVATQAAYAVSAKSVDTRRFDNIFTNKIVDALPIDNRNRGFDNFIDNLIRSGFPNVIKSNNPFDTNELPKPIRAYGLHDYVFDDDAPSVLESVTGMYVNDGWIGIEQSLRPTSFGEPLAAVSAFGFAPALNNVEGRDFTIAFNLYLTPLSGVVVAPGITLRRLPNLTIEVSTGAGIYYYRLLELPNRKNYITVLLHIHDMTTSKLSVGSTGYLNRVVEYDVPPVEIAMPFKLNSENVHGIDGDVRVGGWFIWNVDLNSQQIGAYVKWVREVVFGASSTTANFGTDIHVAMQLYQNYSVNGDVYANTYVGRGGNTLHLPFALDVADFVVVIKNPAKIPPGNDDAFVVGIASAPSMFSVRLLSNGNVVITYMDVEYTCVRPEGNIVISAHNGVFTYTYQNRPDVDLQLQNAVEFVPYEPSIIGAPVLFGDIATSNKFTCTFEALRFIINPTVTPNTVALCLGG